MIETESERLIREGMHQGKIQMLIEMRREVAFDDATILKRRQEKIGLSLQQATEYLEQYGKLLV